MQKAHSSGFGCQLKKLDNGSGIGEALVARMGAGVLFSHGSCMVGTVVLEGGTIGACGHVGAWNESAVVFWNTGGLAST